MASLIEIMQLCRLCLVKDQVNIPIFEEQGDIRQIFLKISACLPVKVSREDNLPKKICDTCSSKLESLYQFWNTSANSEKQLLKWLSQVGVEKTSGRVAQSHSINSDGVVLKQEVVELADTHSVDDDLAPDDLNISNDAHDYILQQQQLPYQPLGFQFQQDGFTEGEGTSSTSGPSATVTSEAADAPKRKRRAAAMKALPAHIDSEEEDEDDVDMVETKIAKTEEQTDESGAEDPEPTAFVGVPSTSADNEQPGPSGVGKGAAEATFRDPLNISEKPVPPDHEVNSLNGVWICNTCNQNFANNADLKDHIFSQVLDMFICCRCGSKFVDEKTFRLHLRDHKRQTVRLCVGNEFPTDSSGKLIDNRVNNMFICKYCDAPFWDRIDFYNHYVTHTKITGKRSMKIKNPTFTKYYRTTNVKNKKKEEQDEEEEETKNNFNVEKLYYGIKYNCYKCDMGFFHTAQSTAHAVKCRRLVKGCDICDEVFGDNLKLFEHYESSHKESKRMCKFCFETFEDEQLLIHHIIKIHFQYKSYCYDCNFGFFSVQKFNNHLKGHVKKY